MERQIDALLADDAATIFLPCDKSRFSFVVPAPFFMPPPPPSPSPSLSPGRWLQ